jgi:hypothetical protein
MPLEYELRYDPTDLDGTVRPIVTEKLGIRLAEFAHQDLHRESANADQR